MNASRQAELTVTEPHTWRWLFWTVAALAALASVVPLYLLSLGPLVWLYGGGYITDATFEACAHPAKMLIVFTNSEWLYDALHWYLALWEYPFAVGPSAPPP